MKKNRIFKENNFTDMISPKLRKYFKMKYFSKVF